MADTKISGLPASTTPLAGTEVLPIVQSSSTVQVSVANLTAGRAVATGALTVTGAISATGVATFSAGTAALPAITTTGDTNTGIFFPAADTIAFTEGGAESMRIDSSGNLLVGNNTDPLGSNKFFVQSASSAANNRTMSVYNTTATSTTPFANRLVQLSSAGSGADVTLHFSDQVANNAYIGMGSGALYFATGGTTERARIDSSGNLLVGQTSQAQTIIGFSVTPAGIVSTAMLASTSAANSYHLYSTGAAAYRFYVGLGGTINATSIVITAISDQRLKENVRDIDTGLDSIMALKPRRFDWKEGKGLDKKNAAGFIAQEFETVFPECVGTSLPGGDGIEYKNINHETLIPTLVKAIQEQQALITQLTARITALETP